MKLKLKRIDKKLWQFEGDTPKRVELAVLDYYKSKGWSGYFTERDNYFWTIAFVAGWGDWSKKRPRTATSIHLLLKTVGYSKTLNKIENSNSSLLLNGLKTARPYFKDYFLLLASKSDLTEDETKEFYRNLLSFFNAVGAKRIRNEIARQFPEERIKRERLMSKFDTKIFRAKPAISLSGQIHEREIITPLNQWGRYAPEDRLKGISDAINMSQKYGDTELVQLGRKAVEAAKLELERIEAAIQYRVLDLVLWKDGQIAYVEVKAPNDRLSQEQCNTIKRNVEEGTLSWVTYVEEAGVE